MNGVLPCVPGISRQFSRSVVVGIILSTHSIPLCTAFQQQDSDVRVNSQIPQTLQISLEGLLRFLERHPADDVSKAMVIKLIDLHGLNFRPTAEDLARLKNAYASPDLLQAIDQARKPPAPEPKPKMGQLRVACRPVDCTVWLNGARSGATQDGVLPLLTLSEGSVWIAATNTNYESNPKKQEALIRQNETTHIDFQLAPSREALVEAGTALFRQMLDALGSSTSELSPNIRATGTISIDAVGEPRAVWPVLSWFSGEDQARFEVSRIRERYQITRTSAGYVWRKPPKTKEARSIEDAIRLVMNTRLARLIGRMKDPRVTMIASDLVSVGQNTTIFRAQGSWGNYVISLDSAHRPTNIEMEAFGLSSGVQIQYSDYVTEDGFSCPRKMRVVLPNGSGVETRYDAVHVSPSEDRHVKAPSK